MNSNNFRSYGEKYFVHPHSNGWIVECDNNSPVSFSFKEKDTAVNTAKELAKQHRTEVVIQKQDGSVEHKLSYH